MAMPASLKRYTVNPEWITYFRAVHSDNSDFKAMYGSGWQHRTPEPYIAADEN